MRAARRIGLALAVLALVALAPTASGAGPTVTYTITAGTAGDNGWYRTDVTVQITVQGATDTTCPSVRTFRSSSDVLNCSFTDGTVASTYTLKFKIDKDAPSVTGAQTDRSPNAAGWFNGPVTVTFGGSDGTSGIASCSRVSYGGPDSGAASVQGSCRDAAGNESTGSSYALKYDATPPSVSATPARKPDGNGWYNHPVAVAFGGTDATSGLDSCKSATYGGPDSEGTAVAGSCTDKAGNVGEASYALKYDATSPKLSGLKVVNGNERAMLAWSASPDVAEVVVQRRPARKGAAAKVVYRGKASAFTDSKLKNGVRYRYTVSGLDPAGNVTTAGVEALPRALVSPVEGGRLRTPPRLAWAAVPKASYYNVQLFRGRLKVLSIWPKATSLKLPRTWKYAERSYRLAPGRYRWYVWPGFGARSARHYGPMLGGSFFFIVR